MPKATDDHGGTMDDSDGPHAPTTRLAFIVFQGGDGPLLGYLGRGVVDQAREELRELGLTPNDARDVVIDVWLDTPGGDADAAYKLMLLLRAHACQVRCVIPDFAKSAGTIVAIGCDEIYMDPAAELGPLDVQVTHEQEGRITSAQDIAGSLTHLAYVGVNIALEAGGAAVATSGLSRQQVLTAMLDYAAQIVGPVAAKLEPSAIHRADSELDIAREYADRLLAMRTGDNLPHPPDLTERLTVTYPHHGFVISSGEARSLGLPIRDMADYDHADLAHALHGKSMHKGGLVEMIDIDSVLQQTQDGHNDEDDEADAQDGEGARGVPGTGSEGDSAVEDAPGADGGDPPSGGSTGGGEAVEELGSEGGS